MALWKWHPLKIVMLWNILTVLFIRTSEAVLRSHLVENKWAKFEYTYVSTPTTYRASNKCITFLLQTCFDDIKRRLSFTSAEQRSALKVCEDNIHTDFVYEVGIMFQEDQYETADRYVEITYVAHVVQVSWLSKKNVS